MEAQPTTPRLDTLEKIAPLLDTVGLHIGLFKKEGVFYMSMVPVSSGENQPEELFTKLSPIVLSGTLEELMGETFEGGFSVAKQVAFKIAGATEILAQANALEEAAKNKKAGADKKASPPATATATPKPAPAGKPTLTNSKFHALLAQCVLGHRGVEAAQKELKNWKPTDEQMAELDKQFKLYENKGKPAEQIALL